MTKRRMRKPESFKTITPEIASQIIELHKEHHRLRHDGLLKLLADANVEVDSAELSSFLDHHETFTARSGSWPGDTSLADTGSALSP